MLHRMLPFFLKWFLKTSVNLTKWIIHFILPVCVVTFKKRANSNCCKIRVKMFACVFYTSLWSSCQTHVITQITNGWIKYGICMNTNFQWKCFIFVQTMGLNNSAFFNENLSVLFFLLVFHTFVCDNHETHRTVSRIPHKLSIITNKHFYFQGLFISTKHKDQITSKISTSLGSPFLF